MIKKIIDIYIIRSYAFICKVYQLITTIYENQFLKIKTPEKQFINQANFKLLINEDIISEKIRNAKVTKVNDFLNIRLLNNNQINDLIRSIFTKTLRAKITDITGFNFSIDFLIFYERKYIPNKKRNIPTLNQAYSYRWHFDKPNSSNMLKIFVPIDVENDSGPLEVINKKDSKKIKLIKGFHKSFKKVFFKGKGNIMYGFYPTLCCHRDGIPNKNVCANQIMFQLNPYKNWVINKRIFSKKNNFKNKIGIWTTEPKFPHISYMFNDRFSLD